MLPVCVEIKVEIELMPRLELPEIVAAMSSCPGQGFKQAAVLVSTNDASVSVDLDL